MGLFMHDWSGMSVIDAIESVHMRDPRKYVWGYFPNDEKEQTGARGFQWFESPREMLDFIIEKESIASHLTGDGFDEEGYRKLVSELKTAVGRDTTLTDQLMGRINSTETWVKIVWWGTFEDLYAGNDGFSGDVIRRFFEHSGSGRTRGPIRPEHLAGFTHFVRDYRAC